MIRINPTNRLPYRDCTVEAFSLFNPTSRESFYTRQPSDNTEVNIGYKLNINSEGYLSNSQQTLSGVWTQSPAIIQVKQNGALIAQWWTESEKTELSAVNNGKLIANPNGNTPTNAVWSANSATNYELDYNDLKNKPTGLPGDWAETEDSIIWRHDVYENWLIPDNPNISPRPGGDPNADILYTVPMYLSHLTIGNYNICISVPEVASIALKFQRPGQKVVLRNNVITCKLVIEYPNEAPHVVIPEFAGDKHYLICSYTDTETTRGYNITVVPQ